MQCSVAGYHCCPGPSSLLVDGATSKQKEEKLNKDAHGGTMANVVNRATANIVNGYVVKQKKKNVYVKQLHMFTLVSSSM